MSFTPDQMAKLISDLEDSKLQVTNLKTEVNADKRLLVIGLGGTGTDALLKIKNMMLKRFNTMEDRNGKSLLPSNVQLLAVDTDSGVNSKSIGGTRFDIHTEVAYLVEPALGAKIRAKQTWPDNIKCWLNPAIQPPSTSGTGAAGVRQLGRLLLFNDIASIINKLENKLRNLLANTPREIPIHVVIVSGISGGTGSGTFIDMGYLVRAVMEKILPGIDRVNITSYLFLPDVNISNPKLPQNCHSYIKSNGVAALKELDYLMNISNRVSLNNNRLEGRFRQIYDNTGSKFGIDTDKPPFDSVYLLSSCQRGGTMFSNGYDYALNVAAESVVNFIALDIVENTEGMDLASFDVNGISMADGSNNALEINGKPIAGNYIYKVVGAASAELPIEDIANYVTYKFFQKVYGLMDFKPSQNDINSFARSTKIAPGELFNAIKLKLNAKIKAPGGNVDARSLSNAVAKANFETALNNYKNFTLGEINDVLRNLDSQLRTSIFDNIKIIFKEKTKGPFYSNRIIIGYGEGGQRVKGIKELVSDWINQMATQAAEASKRAEAKRELANNEYLRGTNAYLYKTNHFEAYKNNLIAHCNEAIDASINDKIKDYYVSGLNKYLSEINTGIFDVYVTILKKLSSVFQETGQLIVEGRTEIIQSGKVFNWNLIETPKILPILDSMIDNYQMESILDKFLTKMIDRSQFWITLNSNSILEEIENFIQVEFTDIVGAGMDTILANNNLNTYIMNVANDLHNQSEPTFPVDTVVAPRIIDYNAISIPYNCEPVRKIIMGYVDDAADVKYTVSLSRLTNRPFWFRAGLGIPLYAYQFLKSYEPEYEAALNGNLVGRHLYEVNTDWKFLPSLVPESIWGYYSNPRVKKLNDERRNMFKEAKAAGIITVDPSNNYYCCLISDDRELMIKIETILKRYNAQADKIDEIPLENLSQCLFELKKLRNLNLNVIDKFYIYDSQGDTPELAEYKAQEHFLMIPELVAITGRELDKVKNLDTLISQLEGLLSNIHDYEETYNHYIDMIVTDTIKRTGLVYSYTIDDEATELIKANAVKYFDYELFENLQKVYAEVLNLLYTRSKQEVSKYEMSDDGLKILLDKLRKMKNRIVSDFQKIKIEGTVNSVQSKFYEMILIFINERIKGIESFTI